jgi:DnaJ-class molecular chaperone
MGGVNMTDMTSMTTLCPECDGYGQYLGEKAIVDYVNGGFYDEVLVECEECEGSGEVEE